MDESYRPVKLRKVVLGFPCSANQTEFKFDLSLNYKMANIIQTYSDQKPALVVRHDTCSWVWVFLPSYNCLMSLNEGITLWSVSKGGWARLLCGLIMMFFVVLLHKERSPTVRCSSGQGCSVHHEYWTQAKVWCFLINSYCCNFSFHQNILLGSVKLFTHSLICWIFTICSTLQVDEICKLYSGFKTQRWVLWTAFKSCWHITTQGMTSLTDATLYGQNDGDIYFWYMAS